MKLSDIKTKTQFFEVADIWYQRTIKLRNISLDKNQSDKRRNKAGFLWFIMFERMNKISQIAIQISKPPKPISNTMDIAVFQENGKESYLLRDGKIIAHEIPQH